jgi:crotonobetainyl-CoA:carnitine CoA-transferase CaiB-like acyl-CoA transferase
MTTMHPLRGVTVVEIGHTVAAPYAGLILAQLGADVVKVENPGTGDYTRAMPPYRGDVSAVYQALNRDKRGVVIDLKNKAEAEALRAFIVQRADVVLHNLKFGAIDLLGFGAGALTTLKPSLIFCNVGAFGHAGPLRERPGYDPLMQAYSGLMSIMGEDGRDPVRVGVSITDMAAGLWAVVGIQAALIERTRTGRGGVVDTSLYETALAWLTVQFASYLASGVLPKREGSGLAQMAPYQAFATADSHVMVAAGNDNNFRKLCAALNRPDLLADPRFTTNKDRVANRPTLIPILAGIFATETTATWLVRLDSADVPCSPINTLDQVVEDPQTVALDMFQESPDGQARVLGVPLSFEGQRPPFVRDAPTFGEHTLDVFPELSARHPESDRNAGRRRELEPESLPVGASADSLR